MQARQALPRAAFPESNSSERAAPRRGWREPYTQLIWPFLGVRAGFWAVAGARSRVYAEDCGIVTLLSLMPSRQKL